MMLARRRRAVGEAGLEDQGACTLLCVSTIGIINIRVGRRYPAAAPDAPPSRPWDSGVRPAPPLAVVASEPTLGATAYVGGGGAGVRSRSPAAGRG